MKKFVLALLSLVLVATDAHAQVITDSLYSPSLSGNLLNEPAIRQILIYTPPGYKEEPQRKYPVVYLLHAYNSGPESWMGEDGYENMNVAEVLDSLVLNSTIDPLLLVMPDAATRFGGSWYTNSASGGNWVDFIAEDLVNYIDSKYRTIPGREARGITGQSMGAYGALYIAMTRPNVFGSVAAVSPVNVANPDPFGQPAHELALDMDKGDPESGHILARLLWSKAVAFSPNPDTPPFFANLPFFREHSSIQRDSLVWQKWQDYALINMIEAQKSALDKLNILFSVGDTDPLIEETKSLSQILSELSIEHRLEVFDGGHVEGVRKHFENDLFVFFDVHFLKKDLNAKE